MDGGHVHGREAVREYWTRQWTMVSPHVEPVGFHRTADGAIIAEVRQSVRDLEGKPLQGQTPFRPEFEPPWIGRPYVAALTINRLAQRDIEAIIDRVVASRRASGAT